MLLQVSSVYRKLAPIFIGTLASAALLGMAAPRSLLGTAHCFAVDRPHVRANETLTTYRADGIAAWSGFGQNQVYRYKYANGILIFTGAALPGPLRSRVTWTGQMTFTLTPLGPEQLAETCRLRNK